MIYHPPTRKLYACWKGDIVAHVERWHDPAYPFMVFVGRGEAGYEMLKCPDEQTALWAARELVRAYNRRERRKNEFTGNAG